MGGVVRQKTVLIVEDSPDGRAIVSTILERHGYRTLHADNGADGVRIASEQLPDLVLMNVTIPGLNGCDATELLKESPSTACIPIVMVTGHMAPAIQEMAWTAGCDDYLLKPVSPHRLLDEVRARIGPAFEA
jgi:two-component system, cell cycle response regulator DivK